MMHMPVRVFRLPNEWCSFVVTDRVVRAYRVHNGMRGQVGRHGVKRTVLGGRKSVGPISAVVSCSATNTVYCGLEGVELHVGMNRLPRCPRVGDQAAQLDHVGYRTGCHRCGARSPRKISVTRARTISKAWVTTPDLPDALLGRAS